MTIKVVDVFAGPGGLNEGFASYMKDGAFPFEVVSSIEKGRIECDTLALRGALRIVERAVGGMPAAYLKALKKGSYLDRLAADREFELAIVAAREHVHEFTLDSSTRNESDSIISEAVKGSDPWVLVGGPPCQLYSLIGRARAAKLPGFEDDVRHVLYKEYLHIIKRHQPDAFVMENVKGMLSAKHKEGQIFDLIREDIARLGYELRSLVVSGDQLAPRDFVIRANEFGVPQKRQRVILFGIRKDRAEKPTSVLESSAEVSVRDAIGGLPAIRSLISPTRRDDFGEWLDLRDTGLKEAHKTEPFDRAIDSHGGVFVAAKAHIKHPSLFGEFVTRDQLKGFAQHQARSHMGSDISRYAYYSERMLQNERVKVNDLPASLLPNHKNVGRKDTPFSDRFRVQGWDEPSTTVVSHISKDGHYFIHPDPIQARSLTVREAARLQSFPDDYVFCGNRTEQYHQVGNAVPPLLAHQIAAIVAELF